MRTLFLAPLTALAMLTVAVPAHAVRVVDTGAPNGNAVGAYTFDGTDFYAGQVDFGGSARIDAVFAHILGRHSRRNLHGRSLRRHDGAPSGIRAPFGDGSLLGRRLERRLRSFRLDCLCGQLLAGLRDRLR